MMNSSPGRSWRHDENRGSWWVMITRAYARHFVVRRACVHQFQLTYSSVVDRTCIYYCVIYSSFDDMDIYSSVEDICTSVDDEHICSVDDDVFISWWWGYVFICWCWRVHQLMMKWANQLMMRTCSSADDEDVFIWSGYVHRLVMRCSSVDENVFISWSGCVHKLMRCVHQMMRMCSSVD